MHFPHPDTALQDVSGGFDLRTRTKQAAAMEILREGMIALSYKMPLDAEGKDFIDKRATEYRYYQNALRFVAAGDSSWRRRFYTKYQSRFARDEDFIVEVAQHSLPPPIARRMIIEMGAESSLPQGETEAEPQPAPAAPPPAQPVRPGIWGSIWALLWSPLGLLLLAGIGIYMYVLNRTPARARASNTYGSARYADVRRTISPDGAGAGVFLGKSSHPDLRPDDSAAPVFTRPERHTLIIASTGTGKGTRIIVPTLLRYPDSMIVVDPKGENAAITARIRSLDLAQTVHILNPWNELSEAFAAIGFPRAATFNPLDALQRNDPDAVAVAQEMATAIVGRGDGKDAVWRGSAASLLTAVILWLTDQPGEEKTLARVRHIVGLRPEELRDSYLARMARSEGFHGAIRENAAPFIGMASDTYTGVIFNLAEATKFISDKRIKDSTGRSSFSMADLLERRTTVYVVVPPDRSTGAGIWLRLVLAAVTHTFRRAKPRKGGPRCMFLIDEFPTLGRVENMVTDIAVMRGYGLDFTLVAQGLEQLEEHYGRNGSRTLIANCAYQWFCNVQDLETAKYLSAVLGKKTVATTTTSTGGPGGAGSTSYGETGRDLLTPDEVLNLGKDVAIVRNPEGHPLYLRPVDYWNLQNEFADLEGMRGYFTPSLRWDDNPVLRKAREEQDEQERQRQEQQKQGRRKKSAAHDGMSRVKALGILGLKDGATAAEIKAAHIRLMNMVHPDKGGTNHFAQELNEAREFLLRTA